MIQILEEFVIVVFNEKLNQNKFNKTIFFTNC